METQEEDAKREIRLEAMRPDKEKVRNWILQLRFIDAPPLDDLLMVEFAQAVMSDLNKFALDAVEGLEQV
jgi:hypothetical protein